MPLLQEFGLPFFRLLGDLNAPSIFKARLQIVVKQFTSKTPC